MPRQGRCHSVIGRAATPRKRDDAGDQSPGTGTVPSVPLWQVTWPVVASPNASGKPHRTPAPACARDRRDLQDERTGRRAGHRSGQRRGLYSVAFVVVNAEQAEDWNAASGREFIEQRERHEQILDRLRARLLAAARIKDGESILDIGCGCGDTTIPRGTRHSQRVRSRRRHLPHPQPGFMTPNPRAISLAVASL